MTKTINSTWTYQLILTYLIKKLPSKATAKEAYSLYELYKDKHIETDYGNFELSSDELLGLCFEATRIKDNSKDIYEIDYLPETKSISINNTFGDYLRVYIQDIPCLINELQNKQKEINK